MKHVSMMPPTDEPAYRRRHEERKVYWMHLAISRAHAKMAEISIQAQLDRAAAAHSDPMVPYVN